MDNKTVRLWDANIEVLCVTFESYSGYVRVVAFSPDGQLLTFASHDNTVKLWDANMRASYGILEGHSI